MSIPSEPTDCIGNPTPIESPAPLDSFSGLSQPLHAAVQRIETLEGEVNDLRQRVGGIRRKQSFGT